MWPPPWLAMFILNHIYYYYHCVPVWCVCDDNADDGVCVQICVCACAQTHTCYNAHREVIDQHSGDGTPFLPCLPGIELKSPGFTPPTPKALLIVYMWVHCHCLQTHQKRASDPITDDCKMPYGCWGLNSGPLEEQSVLLTAESSL